MVEHTISNNIRIALVGDANSANVKRWIIGLQKVGCKIYLISFKPEQENPFAKTFSIPFPKMPCKLHYIFAKKAVKRILNNLEPDIVIGYSASGYGILAGLASNKPIVIAVTGSDILDTSFRRIPIKILSKFILRKADLITAWEKHMEKAVTEFGINGNKVFVLPSGIDMKKIRMQSIQENKNKHISIISTRSLYKLYNHDLLLDSFKLVRYKNKFLTFAGKGPELTSLKENALRLGIIEKVQFLGFVNNENIGKILGKHHIYISLSPRDGVSASLLEAMAAGLFPIVFDNEANRNWITDNENGILLKSFNPEYISQRISDAILMQFNLKEIAEYNYEIIKKEADLFANSKRFVNRFKELTIS